MRNMIGRRAAKAAAVAALTMGAVSLGMGNAFAAGPGGSEACPGGNVCLYYNSPGQGWGSWEDWSAGQSLYLGYFTFAHWANGSGYGVNVKGNAASIVNNTNHTVTVYEIGNGSVSFPSGYAGSLGAAWNNDWSLIS